MKYTIYKDGTFDITGAQISLLGCYPAMNGCVLHPVRVKTEENSILYDLPGGIVELLFQMEREECLSLQCRTEGFTGVHDLSPLAGGKIVGAGHIYTQGLGMEGPSGVFSLDEAVPVSHGLTAVFEKEHALLAYAKDHRRYSLMFRAGCSTDLFRKDCLFQGGFNLEGTGKDTVVLPILYFEEVKGLAEGLRTCAGRIASEMGARQKMPPAFFWSSWYHAYETMDQQRLEETLSGIRKNNIPFQCIELDAGYTPSLGDWLIPNHRWPGGLKMAARTILDAGFQPGIWIGPFIVGDRSMLYREHPDWVLHNPEGKPLVQLRSYTEPKIWGNPDSDYFVLDTSHPDALQYLGKVFRTLKEWGFTFFKTDFMLWNMHDTSEVRRYDPGLTSVQILRNTLAVIRDAIGEDSFLLGCIAPFMPLIGYVDGMRIAGDCGAKWSEPYGPVNMLRELPCGNYFNHIFWQNDPDAMMLRDFDTNLTPEEVRSLALLQALSGGMVSTSDPVDRISQDRQDLLRLVIPDGPVTPVFPDINMDHPEMIMLTHQLEQGNLLFIMNPTDRSQTVFCRLSDLFGKEEWYQYCFSWEQKDTVSAREDTVVRMLAPHDSVLLFVTRKPLTRKPENLWNW